MGGQLVFDWDRLENYLITRDRPVGNIITNKKCHCWVLHVQTECTIVFVSDAQTEGKVSVTPKSWLPRNNRKSYYNTFAASAELAYGQPSEMSTDQDWSQFWPDQDWIGLQFFGDWRIRTGSDWENIFCFNVIILNVSKTFSCDPILPICSMAL